jgi:hypothetical protein
MIYYFPYNCILVNADNFDALIYNQNFLLFFKRNNIIEKIFLIFIVFLNFELNI